MNLSELIAVHKSGRSYEELARDSGDALTAQRLQQIATTAPKAFPSADTIRGLARGLRVSESVVVLAVAESLGLDVARAVPRLVELLPAAALSISDRQAAAIAEVIRAFTDQRAGEEHDRRSAPIAKATRPTAGTREEFVALLDATPSLRPADRERLLGEWDQRAGQVDDGPVEGVVESA